MSVGRLGSLAALALLCAGPAFGQASPAHERFQEGRRLEARLLLGQAWDAFRRAADMAPTDRGYREHLAWSLARYGLHEEASATFEELRALGATGPVDKGLGWMHRELGQDARAAAAYRRVWPDLAAGSSTPEVLKEAERRLAQERAEELRGLQGADAEKRRFQLLLDGGDLKAAIPLGRVRVAAHPDDRILALTLARALLWAGELVEARKLGERLVAAAPESAYLHFLLGRVHAAAKEHDQAERRLRRAVELRPRTGLFRRELVEHLAARGKLDAALDVAKQGDPETFLGRLTLARAYHFGGALERARPRYLAIREDHPNQPDVLRGSAEVAIYSGRVAEGHAVLEQARRARGEEPFQHQAALLDRYRSPRAQARAEYYENHLRLTRTDLGAEGDVWAAPWLRFDLDYQFSYFTQSHFRDVRRHHAGLEGRLAFADWGELAGRMAVSLYEKARREERASGFLALRVEPLPWISTELRYERQDVVDIEGANGLQVFNQSTVGAAALALSSRAGSLKLRALPHDRVELTGEVLYGRYSDGNYKFSWFFQADVVAWWRPRVTVGYGYYFLDFQRAARVWIGPKGRGISAYYDPPTLEVHTLVVRVWEQIGLSTRFGIESRTSYSPKAEGWGQGVWLFVHQALGERGRLRAEGRYFTQNHSVTRAGRGGYYDAFTLTLQLDWTF